MSATTRPEQTASDTTSSSERLVLPAASAVAGVLLCVTYWSPVRDMYLNWSLVDSYYSHGFLIVPISLYFVWVKRGALRALDAAARRPSALGYPFVAGAALLLLGGDFLGFSVFQQLSFVPMVAGITLLLLGSEATKILWFPIAFLLLMIPIPSSITQSLVFDLKIFAADSAVGLAKLLTLPIVREGSYIYFKDDALLVGNVCGGLRSLIALFSVGTLMAYVSRTRLWARFSVLAMSVPIAIVANIARIFVLSVVAYFWGSDVAGGLFHDVSGIFIFVVAFALFFSLESLLRRLAPDQDREGEAAA